MSRELGERQHERQETSLLVYIPNDFLQNLLYGEAPPERGAFSRPQVYKRSGISQIEVYEGVRKSVI